MTCGVISPFPVAVVTLVWHCSHQGLPAGCGRAQATLEGCLLKRAGWMGQVCKKMPGYGMQYLQNRWKVLALAPTSIWLSKLGEEREMASTSTCIPGKICRFLPFWSAIRWVNILLHVHSRCFSMCCSCSVSPSKLFNILAPSGPGLSFLLSSSSNGAKPVDF